MIAVVHIRDFPKLGEQFVAMRIKLQGTRSECRITSSLVRGKMRDKFWPVRRAWTLAEVWPHILAEDWPHIQPEVWPHILAEVWPHIQAEVRPHILAEVRPHILAEVWPHILAEVWPRILAEVRPNILAEVWPHTVAEGWPHVPKNGVAITVSGRPSEVTCGVRPTVERRQQGAEIVGRAVPAKLQGGRGVSEAGGRGARTQTTIGDVGSEA